jgi:hypothetical protein
MRTLIVIFSALTLWSLKVDIPNLGTINFNDYFFVLTCTMVLIYYISGGPSKDIDYDFDKGEFIVLILVSVALVVLYSFLLSDLFPLEWLPNINTNPITYKVYKIINVIGSIIVSIAIVMFGWWFGVNKRTERAEECEW